MLVDFHHPLTVARPGWLTANAVLSPARSATGFLILVPLIRAGHWVEISGPSFRPTVASMTQHGFDTGMQLAVLAGGGSRTGRFRAKTG